MRTSLCASTAVLALVAASALTAPAIAADLSIAPIYKALCAHLRRLIRQYAGGAAHGAARRCEINATGQIRRHGLTSAAASSASPRASTCNAQTTCRQASRPTSRPMSKKGARSRVSPNAAFSNEVSERWLSTFRGRIGYARDNWLLYATAGGALANVANNLLSPSGKISDQQWHWGWTAGGGVEGQAHRGLVQRKWNTSTSDCRTNPYFNPTPSPVFAKQSAPAPRRPHRSRRRQLQAAVEYSGQLLQALSFEIGPYTARGRTAFPSRACLSMPARRAAGRRPAATAGDGRCGGRRSSARRPPGSPKSVRTGTVISGAEPRRSIPDDKGCGIFAGCGEKQRVVHPPVGKARIELGRE